MNLLKLFAAILLLSSCNEELLNTTPPDNVSSVIFWKSPGDADLALTGCYESIRGGWQGWTVELRQPFTWDAYSDDAYTQYDYAGGRTASISGITPQTGGHVSSYYSSCYASIATINYYLANVDRVLSGDKLNLYKAEGYFLRAFNYLWLAQLYGNVPILKDDPFLLTPSATFTKSSRDEVLNFVLEDLQTAIASLPDDNFSSTGHVTKGTALGYLARVYLFQHKYIEAAAAAKQVIDGAKYSLNPNYAGNFYKPDQLSSPEIMFSVQYSPGVPPHWDFITVELFIQTWKGYLATQDLVDEFEDGDPRKTMSFFFEGDTYNANGWPFDGVATAGLGDWVKGYYPVKKWMSPGSLNPAWGGGNFIDFVLLRFADVKLMYAEAQNEVVGPDASVYKEVNDVRARPGVEMPNLASGLSQSGMRDAIRHERRVEFPMEGLRYFDLRRWGIAEQKLNGFVSNPLIPSSVNVYAAKYDFWPIPQSEIDRNQGSLLQNDGY